MKSENADKFLDITMSDLLNNTYLLPELPKVKIKEKGILYEITDIRYLNETAVDVLFKIIDASANDPELKDVSFYVGGLSESILHLISDILMTTGVDSRKKGRNAWLSSFCIVNGVSFEDDDTLTFHLKHDLGRAISNYSQGKKEINYFDLMISMAQFFKNEF